MSLRFTFLLAAAALVPSGRARADVFHSRGAALKLAFPDADRVEPRTFFLTPEQQAQVEQRAGSRLDSRMISLYVGTRQGAVLGYAFIDTHPVRTMPETFMVVLSPSGSVRATHILAFHEPTDYLPPERWLAQFNGRRLSPSLRLSQEIAGIAGSSLSAQAVTAGVRRILALYEVMLGGPPMASTARPHS